MQHVSLFVGLCEKANPKPYVPSALVACELPGCGHKVWCESKLAPMLPVLTVVCGHDVEALFPKHGPYGG